MCDLCDHPTGKLEVPSRRILTTLYGSAHHGPFCISAYHARFRLALPFTLGDSAGGLRGKSKGPKGGYVSPDAHAGRSTVTASHYYIAFPWSSLCKLNKSPQKGSKSTLSRQSRYHCLSETPHNVFDVGLLCLRRMTTWKRT